MLQQFIFRSHAVIMGHSTYYPESKIIDLGTMRIYLSLYPMRGERECSTRRGHKINMHWTQKCANLSYVTLSGQTGEVCYRVALLAGWLDGRQWSRKLEDILRQVYTIFAERAEVANCLTYARRSFLITFTLKECVYKYYYAYRLHKNIYKNFISRSSDLQREDNGTGL